MWVSREVKATRDDFSLLFFFSCITGFTAEAAGCGLQKMKKKNGKVQLVCFSVSSAAAPRFDLDFYRSQLTGEIVRPDGAAALVPWVLVTAVYMLAEITWLKIDKQATSDKYYLIISLTKLCQQTGIKVERVWQYDTFWGREIEVAWRTMAGQLSVLAAGARKDRASE